MGKKTLKIKRIDRKKRRKKSLLVDYHYFSWILESVSKTLASYFYQSVFLLEHKEIVFQILSFFSNIFLHKTFYFKAWISSFV